MHEARSMRQVAHRLFLACLNAAAFEKFLKVKGMTYTARGRLNQREIFK
jgi:hypothetical protein